LNALQTCTYTYDNLNRLTHAVFTQDKYNETLSYDKNGNIQSLQRKGKAGEVYTTIDQLSYAYHGNRLLAVNDLNTTDTQAHGFTDNGLFKTGNPTDPLTQVKL
jgi:hypothetical protein